MFQGDILIVDEHHENKQQVSLLLRLSGFKVTLSRTSSAGSQWFESRLLKTATIHSWQSRLKLKLMNYFYVKVSAKLVSTILSIFQFAVVINTHIAVFHMLRSELTQLAARINHISTSPVITKK